jgi:hypothetical protein
LQRGIGGCKHGCLLLMTPGKGSPGLTVFAQLASALKFDLVATSGGGKNERCIRNFVSKDQFNNSALAPKSQQTKDEIPSTSRNSSTHMNVDLLVAQLASALKFDLVATSGGGKNERCIRNFVSKDQLVFNNSALAPKSQQTKGEIPSTSRNSSTYMNVDLLAITICLRSARQCPKIRPRRHLRRRQERAMHPQLRLQSPSRPRAKSHPHPEIVPRT